MGALMEPLPDRMAEDCEAASTTFAGETRPMENKTVIAKDKHAHFLNS
jgi:hypothetical protein